MNVLGVLTGRRCYAHTGAPTNTRLLARATICCVVFMTLTVVHSVAQSRLRQRLLLKPFKRTYRRPEWVYGPALQVQVHR